MWDINRWQESMHVSFTHTTIIICILHREIKGEGNICLEPGATLHFDLLLQSQNPRSIVAITSSTNLTVYKRIRSGETILSVKYTSEINIIHRLDSITHTEAALGRKTRQIPFHVRELHCIHSPIKFREATRHRYIWPCCPEFWIITELHSMYNTTFRVPGSDVSEANRCYTRF